MSSKFGFYWQAVPAVAVMAAFLMSVSDTGSAAESAAADTVATTTGQPATPPVAIAATAADATLAAPAAATVSAPVTAPASSFTPVAADSDSDAASGLSLPEAEVMCLAKIIHHESANQPDSGQFAVAHVVLNRLASPRFPKSICSIALQPGQFFNVHAYNPSGHSLWAHSQQIARRALAGEGRNAAPGALFFHTAGYSSRFFRSRPRVTQIAGHVFYR